MSQEIAQLFAKISADTSDFNKGMKQVKDDMTAQEKGLSMFGNAIGTGLKVAAGVGIAAVAGLATGIGHAVSKAVDMEQALADTTAVMGLTDDQSVQLKDHIMDLGLDPKLKITAVEASEAVMTLGTAGLTLDEIMNGASESVVLLSNATGGGASDSAALLTDIMGQFNITAAESGQIVDQVTGLTVASKFAFNDAADAIAQVGGMASAVGVELPDLTAALAATSHMFASGSDAGTSFKTFLTSLIPKSNEAKDVMSSLGLVTTDWTRAATDLSGVLGYEVEPSVNAVFEAFSKTDHGMKLAAISEDKLAKGFQGLRGQYEENEFFDDTTGAMKDMDQVAEILSKATAGLTEEQKNNAIATIFGADAMRTAFGLMEAGAPGIKEMKRIIGDTNAEEMAAKRMDTLRGSWEIFLGIVETLTLGLGDKFLPVVRSVVDWLTSLAQTYGPMVIDMFGVFGDRIAEFLPLLDEQNALYEDGSGLLMELTKVFGVSEEAAQAFWMEVWSVKQTVDTFIQSVKDSFAPITDLIAKYVSWQDVIAGTVIALTIMLAPAIATVIGALGAFVLSVLAVAAPILAAIAVVATLRAAWETDFGGIQEKTRTALTYVSDTFGGLYTTIETFGVDALREIADWATGNETQFTAVKAIWESAKTSFGTAFDDMKQKVSDWADVAWKAFKVNFPEAAEALKDAWESISTKFGEMWDVIKPLIDTAVETFGDLVEAWQTGGTDMGTALQTAKTVLDGVWKIMITSVETSINSILLTLKLVGQLLSGDWAGAWNTAKSMVTNVLDGIKTVVTTAFNTVMQAFGVNISDLAAWRDSAVNTVTQMRDTVANRITELKDGVISRVREFTETTRNTIETWRASIVQKYTDIVSAIKDKMAAVGTAIIDPIKTATDSTKETISDWRDSLAELVGRLRENILAHMAGIKANVVEPVKLFISDTAERIAKWVTWVVENWQEIKDKAKEKWDAIKAAVVDPVVAFIDSTKEKMGGWKDWLVAKFNEAWTAVKNALNPEYWLRLGKDLIQGLWDGITEKWNSFTTWLNNAWDSIKDKVNQVFWRRSPSGWFAELGIDMMLGLSGGISDAISGVTAVFDGLSTSISNSMSSVVSTLTTQINSAMTSVVEGVRYGAGLVNQATADVLAQSRAAELASRNAWEAMQTAARQAALNMPAPPPPVGVGADELLGNNAPAPGSISQAPTPMPGMPGAPTTPGMPAYVPPLAFAPPSSIGNLLRPLEGIVTPLRDTAIGVINSLRDEINTITPIFRSIELPAQMAAEFDDMVDVLRASIGAVSGNLKDALTGNELKSGFMSLASNLQAIVTDVKTHFRDDTPAAAKQALTDMMQDLLDAIATGGDMAETYAGQNLDAGAKAMAEDVATGLAAVVKQTVPIFADFGAKKMNTLLDDLDTRDARFDSDVVFERLNQFARDASTAIFNRSGQLDADTSNAYQTAQYSGNATSQALLQAIQVLIQKISAAGLGNQFNLNLAPGNVADDREELGALVAYLAAQYA